MALVSCWPEAACFALPVVCCPGAQSFAEFGLVEFVCVWSVLWLLGIVVDEELDEVPDCAVASPPERASKVATRRIRFMTTGPFGNAASVA
ncbi:hypothetical protein [Mesorhizobium sp. RIZ17]|uniref:hypothetical protein n=1 Tax=Mesorhizobium sp. RIZ17 TaxID=3132743 RepID=UPI003DA9C479